MSPPTERKILALGLVCWVAAITFGFGLIWRYKMTPGEPGAAPPVWPEAASFERARDRFTLVLWAHPKCSCTRATLAELSKIVPRFASSVRAYVVFIHPSGVGDDWEATDLWQRAGSIPGVQTVRDDDDRLAALFHIATSGTVLLYDSSGALRFNGGITSARGHEGDSAGAERLEALLTTGAADRNDSPVFGCSLHENEGG
jgi:hypothetical protein